MVMLCRLGATSIKILALLLGFVMFTEVGEIGLFYAHFWHVQPNPVRLDNKIQHRNLTSI